MGYKRSIVEWGKIMVESKGFGESNMTHYENLWHAQQIVGVGDVQVQAGVCD